MSYMNSMRRYLFKLKKYLPKVIQPAKKPSDRQLKKLAKRDITKPKQTALLIAYSGKNYSGVNFSWEVPTIEHEILKVLHAIGVTPPVESGVQKKMLWNQPNITEAVNERLPPDIRLIDCVKAPRNFVDHQTCTQRTYSYTIPTYAFAPLEQTVTLDYRVSADILERLNEVMEKFWNSHSFHNFTMHRESLRKSPWRQIHEFECGLPFVVDGVEFCTLRIRGQSFMMHQIRKMVGLTIAVVRGFCDTDTIDLCWEDVKVDIPKAPGLGLVLEKLHFARGNDVFDGPLITDERKNAIKAKLDDFRENHIRAEIIRTEIESTSMLNWLKFLHFHMYKAMKLDGSERHGLFIMYKKLVDASESSDIEDADEDETVGASADDFDTDNIEKQPDDTLLSYTDGDNDTDLTHSYEDKNASYRPEFSDSRTYVGRETGRRTHSRTSQSEEAEQETELKRKQSV